MSKKLMTLLLLSALLLGTACGNGGTPTDTDNQTSSGDQPEESTSSLSYIDKLETKDFGGYEFNICTEGAFDNFYVEEADGDVINDSVFKRNSEVEQRYNIKLNFENIEWKTAPDTIQQNVLAGDKAFDLWTATHLSLGSTLTGGYLRDWQDVSTVDLSNPYYIQAADESYSIGGHTKLLFGDFMDSNLKKAYVMLFNQRLTEQYGIEGLYDTVDSGKWTIDYFSDIIKDIHSDLNGDTIYDENDFYGFGTDNYAMVDSWSKALGFTAIDNSGKEPKLDFYKESTVDAYKKLYDLYFNNPGVYGKFEAFQARWKMFTPGNCVFTNSQIGDLLSEDMRNMKDDYGVLPYPKFNEAQEGYYTHLDGTFSAQLITITLPDEDLERTGTIVEALNAYSREYTIPAIYDVALKVKASRDDDSVRMLDLTLAGRRYSLDSMDESNFPLSAKKALRYQIQAGNENIASYYEANKTAAEEWITAMVNAFNESEK